MLEKFVTIMKTIGISLLVLILLVLISNPAYVYITRSTKIVEIKETLNKINPEDNQDQYLVFTKNNQGVFQNTDSIWFLKYDSSDLQAMLEDNKKYQIHYYGLRVPILSWYPNIYDAQLIE